MRKHTLNIILAGFFSIYLYSCKSVHISNTDALINQKVDSILSLMTLEEKAGQMLNLGLAALLTGDFYSYRDSLVFDSAKVNRLLIKYGAGSVQNLGFYPLTPVEWRHYISYIQNVVEQKTRLKIPVLYGIDAVHGANYTAGSVLFPHQINLAATFDPDWALKAGEVTAYEMKAGAITWNYCPNLDVARNPLWGRIYESFGEDPYVVATMGAAMFKGMQGDNPSDWNKVIASGKHFVGYGAPVNGKDRSPVVMPEQQIRQILLPPFEEAVKNGLLSVMVSSSAINGLPTHIDHHLLTDILKNEFGFKGVIISDWGDIDNLYAVHKVAKDEREAVKLSVLAGIDMCMDPYDASFAEHLIDLVNTGEIPQSRIDDAVRRILYVKYKSGIFEDKMWEKNIYENFASPESDSLNLEIARESITLLKNLDNILPLAKNSKVLVTGVSANSLNYLNGGWSRTWSGENPRFNDVEKLTILDAIKTKVGSNNVLFAPGTNYLAAIDIAEAVNKAKFVDVIIACVGEKPATEKPSDIEDLELPEVQQDLVKKLAATGKPVILVMTQGRPRIIREIEPLTHAIIMAYLPGNEGGKAISDVLFGDFNPCGKLPYTYPRYSGSLWTYDHQLSDERDVNFEMNGFTPQFEFGYGLSYTQFKYNNISISSDSVKSGESLTITIEITNTGKFEGRESVLLFVSDEIASLSPAVKQLKRFKKINLKPGETQRVDFELNIRDLEFVNATNKWVHENGYFTLTIGNQKKRFYLYE